MENTQILPLLWVIEELASYKSVDTSLLLQLAKIIPDKHGEMGTNAREAVSLSILKGLAARDDEENDSISDSGERIKFDPSESCEDVLQQILEDVQAPDVENGGQKMLKWDVQSFIASKRARLNCPVLEKLKDAFLDGSHSVIESIKERTGIAVRTRNNVSANGGHSDELVQRHEERGKNIEAEREAAKKHKQAENCPRHDSVGFTIASSQHEIPVKPSEILVENVEPEVHRSDKEAESVGSSNNMEKRRAYDAIATEACGGTEREAAKRHKQVENCPRHDSVGVTIISSQHEVPKKPSENLVENVETETHRPDKEADVENEFVVSPNDMEDQETQLRSSANPVDEDNGKKLSGQVQGQNDKIGESHRGREGNELRTSIQDFLAPQLKLCVKCHEGGKVLECSSDTCAIAVHESCLGTTVNMDCGGRFYCPSCEYSRAVSKYLEVAKRATLARKKLTIYIGQKVDN